MNGPTLASKPAGAVTDTVHEMQRQGAGASRLHEIACEAVPVVLIDVLDEETLREAGRLVWHQRGAGLFSASSSGLQYALAAHWRDIGLLPRQSALPAASAVPRIAVVSGNCSPVTAGQIRWARSNGFSTERLHLPSALAAHSRDHEIERVVGLAAAALNAGRSALVFSAEGPDDASVVEFDAIALEAGLQRSDAARTVGAVLADVMRRLLERVELQRVVVAGGDSSGEVASALDIEALTVTAGLTPGAPRNLRGCTRASLASDDDPPRQATGLSRADPYGISGSVGG